MNGLTCKKTSFMPFFYCEIGSLLESNVAVINQNKLQTYQSHLPSPHVVSADRLLPDYSFKVPGLVCILKGSQCKKEVCNKTLKTFNLC